MKIPFTKYHGTGNDFILIDNRSGKFDTSRRTVSFLCHRRFGIGADGLILLNSSDACDFEMVYYNSDGIEGTMCGNGGRCVVAFANHLKLIDKTCIFDAIDGKHKASVSRAEQNITFVDLQMSDVLDIYADQDSFVLNTGSPHLVKFVDQLEHHDVRNTGGIIRNSDPFREHGINVNFVEIMNDHTLFVRTYERGVEDETLSCGTGVVASAISFAVKSDLQQNEIRIVTPGGQLIVNFKQKGKDFTEIFLKGPATKVFEGIFDGNILNTIPSED